ncbi:MAG: hypothetical protein PHS17_05870 [Desulfobacterales bacterium]|nr:hypothetical protein [Desulfobacterales bacterium]
MKRNNRAATPPPEERGRKGPDLANMKEKGKNQGRGHRKTLPIALALGLLAGFCFNLAFGSTAWCSEGLLGGLISAVLVYIST